MNVNAPILTESVRIPLHELQADVDYLIGRVLADGSDAPMIAASIKDKLAKIEAALIQPQQMRERIAELQYEAGMYHSLYESLWACSGCGTRKSMEQIKGETPQAISCCPEREMVPAHTRPECGKGS